MEGIITLLLDMGAIPTGSPRRPSQVSAQLSHRDACCLLYRAQGPWASPLPEDNPTAPGRTWVDLP